MSKSPLGIAIADANGDLAAGILLYRVRYWQPRAVVKFGPGDAWIAKTRSDWCDETSLTLKQYKRALALLLRLGKVQSSIHKFGSRTMTHLRTRGLAENSAGDAPAVSPGSVPAVPSGSAQVVPEGSIQVVPPGSTQVVPQGANVYNIELPTGDNNTEIGAYAQEDLMKKDKLVAVGSSNKPLDQAEPPKFFTRLELAYRAAFKETTGYLAASWGPKARGQMKHVIEHLKQEGIPPDKCIEIVATAVRNWEVFRAYVAKSAGKKVKPTSPSVEYMATYRQYVWPYFDLFHGEGSTPSGMMKMDVEPMVYEDVP
jgi:hypothetical protein